MAEAPPPVIEVAYDISETVRVRNVTQSGEIEFFPALHDNLVIQSPPNVKLPIPNDNAYQLLHSALVDNVYYLEQMPGETMEYNIFFNTTGAESNVSYALYGMIVHTLISEPINLPEVDVMGTCRISPLCDTDDLYVQPRPAHVDTVAYMIYVAMFEKTQNNLIQPAQEVAVDGMYIFSSEDKQYRVRLKERIIETEPPWFQNLMRKRVLRERQKNLSIGCAPGDVDSEPTSSKGSLEDTSGEKRNDSDEEFPRFEWSERNIFDRTFGEKVEVFRIDYGGPTLTVHRADLYNVDDVCPDLNYIEDLAIRVDVHSINNSDEDIDARLEELRKSKQIINIATVAEAVDSPALINIFHEQNLE